MSKKYDVVATIGSYQKDGETKYLNRNVGAVIQTQHGFRLKLDASFNPAGCPKSEDGGVWLALFEPRPKSDQPGGQSQGSQQTNSNPQSGGGGFADFDDVPFGPVGKEWMA